MKRRIGDFVVCGMVSQINVELERRGVDPRDIVNIFHSPRYTTQYGPMAQSFHVLYIEEVEERKDLMTEIVKLGDLERRIAKIKSWFHTLDDVEIVAVKHEDNVTYAKIRHNGEEYLMRATNTSGRVSVARDDPKYSPFPELNE